MPKNQPTPRTTPYNKVNFTAEGGFDTKNRRTGKARADAYFTRGNNIISRPEELHTITGAEIKVIIIPTWTGGKPKVWQSNDFPDLQEVTVDPTVNEKENAETVEMAAVGTAPSPRKEPLSEIQATNIPSTSASTSASKSKNRCAICHIVYGSEADIESLWVQCSKNGCSWWVHCRCICIQYPATDARHRALKKWSINKVFCPKHIQ